MMDFNSAFNIVIGSEDENGLENSKHSNEDATESSDYVAAQSEEDKNGLENSKHCNEDSTESSDYVAAQSEEDKNGLENSKHSNEDSIESSQAAQSEEDKNGLENSKHSNEDATESSDHVAAQSEEDENELENSKHSNEDATESSDYVAAQSESSLYASLDSETNTAESPNVSYHLIYTRDELVECSLSLICLQPPPNWDIVVRKMPEIVLKVPKINQLKVKLTQLEERPWQMENLAKRNAFAWKNGHMADCSLVVGEEKKEFQCHKYFLCLASSVLADALKDSEENQQIFLPNISSLNFHKVLEYIYTDNIKKKNMATIQSAWIAARELGIIALEQYCVTCARQKVCVSNICSTLQFARLMNDEEFELFCIQYIQENTAKVLQVTDWRNIEQRTLETILKLENVNETCELDLFKACLKWANMNTPPDGSKRDTLGPLIGLIRFLTLNVKDFALTVYPTKLLTLEETVAIFYCFATGTRDMPAGFSIESTPRNRVTSSDILESSTSNVYTNSCISEVPSHDVQTNQVESNEPEENESSIATGNDTTEVLLNQELATPIPPLESSYYMGREDDITLPFGDNKNVLVRYGEQIKQTPLSFSVSKMAYILGFDLISWRIGDEGAYYESLQVTLKTQGGTKVAAKFVGPLKRLKRFQVNFDDPVIVYPDTIYKVNVLYADPSIKHTSYLFTPYKKNFETSWGMKVSFKTTLNHYTNIRAIYFAEILQ